MMALLRGVRRRCRQANPCTTLLFLLFLAVAFYLISAIYGIYAQRSVAEGLRDRVGPGRRLSGDDGPAGQRRRKDRPGSFVVGDDEIQLCRMTSEWALSAVEQQDYLQVAGESGVSATAQRQGKLGSCTSASVDPPPQTLFYVDSEGILRYNHTAGGKYEVAVDSCEAWKIEWNSETGYVEHSVPLSSEVDADFVRVSCRIRRVDGAGRTTPEPLQQPRLQRRRGIRSSERHLSTAERRARQIHRDQLRRFSPHLVGAVGLPDPLIAEERTSPVDAVESKNRATQNELRSRHDEQASAGPATHTAGRAESGEHRELRRGRKLEGVVDGESERDENQIHESDDVDSSSTEVYEQWIAHIHPVSEVVDGESGRKLESDRLNVLVLALESVSSISFDRVLPKSRQFFVDQHNTVLFTGYNVIGDAAPANIIPLLTGVTLPELSSERVGGEHSNFVDALPFVWNKFEQAGYVTLYTEDRPLDTFHTDFHGFEQPPVHHYMRPFWQAAEAAGRRSGCLGALPEYQYVFRYVSEFLSSRYPAHVPRFAFAFVSSGDPRSFDDDLSVWLEELRRSGALERTAVLVVGDHGPSHGRRRHTALGKAAERLPLLVVGVPAWFAERRAPMMKNLATNRDRLVTPLDVHRTLLALLDTTDDSSTQVNAADKTAAATLRGRSRTQSTGVSLFEVIPVGRTCRSAGVPVHWCMCTYVEWAPDATESSEWRSTADWVVGRINDLLRPAISGGLCQPLTMLHVVNAQYVIPTDLVVDVENRFYYGRRLSNFTGAHPSTVRYQQVVVETTPRGATFEATVIVDPTTTTRRLSGEMSRISAYDGQSDCVIDTHPELRRFCICK